MFECPNLLITPEKILIVLSGIATPAIALIVAVITWQNWRTNQGALREKLFERRFAIFQETQEFLIMLTGKDDQIENKIWHFTDTCQRSRFLFGHAIHDYLDGIRRMAFDTQFQKTVMENPSGYEDSQDQIRSYNENKRLYNRQLTEIFNEFSPYLSFEKHR